MTHRPCGWWTWPILLLVASSCNSPYPASDEGANILYMSFTDEPRHLDPARAYGGVAYSLICHIVEAPFQYRLLERPYALEPRTAEAVPEPQTRDIEWQGKTIRKATVYTVRLKRGIFYQDHPCFVEANRRLTDRDAHGIRSVADFAEVSTREMVAADFVLAARRLADPRLSCPIIDTLKQNILGLAEYGEALGKALDAERERRREAGGPLYSREQDEKYHPVQLDYMALPLPGVREVDRHTFEIVLKRPYPQILFWMAMPFFAPVPQEAIDFFEQRVLLERSIIFDKNPVGTGPYVLAEFDPTNQLVLKRNPRFRKEHYPGLPTPEPSDRKAVAHYEALRASGMFDDVGRELPMIDRIVFRREVEWIPYWAKFRQGYYDASGISSDVFDQSIALSSKGDAVLSDDMTEQGIRLLTAPSPVVSYFAFNMQDPVVGGFGESARKLRQAIGVAFDTEEQIAIFLNGRGAVAHSLTPPGIFGHMGGEAGINPVTHGWDRELGCAARHPLQKAKSLLKEAGYEDGYGQDGQQLVLYFDNGWKSASLRPRLKFVVKQFEKLGIRLVSRTTDYNVLNDKLRAGNFQILSWGWMADYPDAENFLFLLYGQNAKTKTGGNNTANYASPDYDRLFEQMSNMDNGRERLAVIRKMNRIAQEDAPWFGMVHPVSFSLVHEWYRNGYPNAMTWNQLKYRRIDVELRARRRREWNRPRWQPVAIALAALVLVIVPAVFIAARHLRED